MLGAGDLGSLTGRGPGELFGHQDGGPDDGLSAPVRRGAEQGATAQEILQSQAMFLPHAEDHLRADVRVSGGQRLTELVRIETRLA